MRFSTGYFHSVLVACLLASGSTFGASAWTEQQTINEQVNGSQGWVASFGTAPQQVTTNGYLSVGGVGGAGQYFVVNQKSQYQIATLTGIKSGGSWSGFGVTYYDATWNEVSVQYKEIKANANNGNASTRYAIGLVPPANAAWAYVWVWNNNGNGYVQAGDFKVVNYFPEGNFNYDPNAPSGSTYTQTFPSNRNRVINGNFETARNAQNGDRYEADEFWSVVGSDSEVFYFNDGGLGIPNGIRMGSNAETNLIYQNVPDVQAGQEYTLKINAGRVDYQGGSPFAVAGVDFYDAGGNKIGSASNGLDKDWIFGKFGGPQLDVINFTPPNGTTRTVLWVWAEATGASNALVYVNSLSIRPREYQAPTIDFVSAPEITTSKSGAATIRIRDNDRIDGDSIDGRDFRFIGPNGQELPLYVNDPNPFFGPGDEYYYYTQRALTSADNGTWRIFYREGEIADVTGNKLYRGKFTYMGSFEVNIP